MAEETEARRGEMEPKVTQTGDSSGLLAAKLGTLSHSLPVVSVLEPLEMCECINCPNILIAWADLGI